MLRPKQRLTPEKLRRDGCPSLVHPPRAAATDPGAVHSVDLIALGHERWGGGTLGSHQGPCRRGLLGCVFNISSSVFDTAREAAVQAASEGGWYTARVATPTARPERNTKAKDMRKIMVCLTRSAIGSSDLVSDCHRAQRTTSAHLQGGIGPFSRTPGKNIDLSPAGRGHSFL